LREFWLFITGGLGTDNLSFYSQITLLVNLIKF